MERYCCASFSDLVGEFSFCSESKPIHSGHRIRCRAPSSMKTASDMTQHQFSPGMPDLFGVVQPSSGPRAEPIRLRAKPLAPKLASLSDSELVMHLADVVREVHRRIPDADARETRPALDWAVQEATAILTRLASISSEEPNRLAIAGASQTVLETKRKAIRAALLAGVKPGQVAKHFGVSLATVRRIATKPS